MESGSSTNKGRYAGGLDSGNGLEVHCNKLSLTIKLRKGLIKKVESEKKILSDVTATFKPGRMTAIMGSSGAGKTSLLSILVCYP